ncbi:MAG: EamA family transporter [Clostridiales bacterium]|nr:EamA family transporter [Clostridiales bacterium]
MNNKLKVNLYSFLTVFLWASAFPFTKVIGDQLSPNVLGFLRCFIAALLLLVISKVTHMRKPFRKKDILYFAAAGATGFSLYLVFFNTGLLTLTSATSSIMTAVAPILTAIAAYKLYKEKINIIGWICIALSFAGAAILLFWNGILSINIGIFWALASSVVFAAYNILNRKLSSKGYTSMEIVTYSVLCGTILLLPFLPQTVSQMAAADPVVIAIVIYLGIMPSAVSYLLWSKGIALAERTSEATNYIFIIPLLSTVMAFLMLHEVPDLGTFIGGAVIIASVVVFSIKGK